MRKENVEFYQEGCCDPPFGENKRKQSSVYTAAKPTEKVAEASEKTLPKPDKEEKPADLEAVKGTTAS